jgi:hypothetical protein
MWQRWRAGGGGGLFAWNFGRFVPRSLASLRFGGRWLATFATFHFVCFAWIFFRAPTFDHAVLALRQLAQGGWTIEHITHRVPLVIAAAVVLHVVPGTWKERLRDAFVRVPAPVQGLVLAAAAVALHLVASAKPEPFVYGQF